MAQDSSKALSDEALRFIVRLHSGAATREDHAAFAQWRRRSRAHEAAAKEAEALWGDAADLHQDDDSHSVQPGRRPPGGGGKVGVLVLLACLGGGAALWATGGWTVWSADESTGVGETRTLVLADGSRVTLNARSALDVRMSATDRRLTLLQGEAFFEVARDARRPFAVSVGGVAVTARGTAFDIDRHADGAVAVAVTDHAVALSPPSGRTIEVEAGNRAMVGADGQIAAIGPIDKASVTAWRKGLLVAENEPLSTIVEALRAYHRGWIIIRDPALARLRVNAVIDLESPEAALRVLEKGLPIRVSTISPFVILIAPS